MFSSIRRRVKPGLIAAYLLAMLLVIAIGVLATLRLNQISTTVDDLTNHLAYDRALADDIVSQALLVRFYANKYVRTQHQADLDRFNAEFASLKQLLDQADRQISNPQRREMLAQIQSAAATYGTTFQRIAALIRQREQITSETLHVSNLTIENDLTALKMHVVSLDNALAFLSFGNAQSATAQMQLNISKYLESGDERYIVLFERSYQQAQSAFDTLERTLQDPAQRKNAAEARQAGDAYREGFQAVRANQVELASLFAEKLDVLEPEISDTAEAMAASVERDFKAQNTFAKSLISQTRLVLATTTTIATLAGLGLGLVMTRYVTEREEAETALRQARDRLEQRVKERTAELRTVNQKLTQEVDERKRAEREIEKRWLYLKAILNAAPDAIVTVDAQNQVVQWNSGAERLFGYSREEAVGRVLDQLITDPGILGEATGLTETTLREGRLGPVETVRCRKDGSQVDVIIAAARVRVAGESIGLVAVYTDITERKRVEKQLELYADELKQSNEEIKHFAYIVSHDLRAPLVNLKGFSTELRFALEDIEATVGDVIPHLDEQQRETLNCALEEDVPEALSFIESSVTRMDNFINAVLRLSRLGRRELQPEPIDMGALIEENLGALAHQIEEKQVDVTIGPLPEVTADRTSMEQIVGNIVGNAVKYLEPDRAGEIEITAAQREEDVLFRVCDNGRGIAEDDMDKVFAPFRRAGRQDAPGEGMGLAYVQTLVRRHGGRIWCESQLGTGTTFYFTVPLEVT